MSQMKLNEQQKKLVEENHKLIYSFLRYRNLSLNSVEDWYGTAAVGLCQAALIYDESRGFKFSTLAYVCMERELLNVKRKNSKNVDTTVSIDERIFTEQGKSVALSEVIPDETDIFQSVHLNDAIESVLKTLSDRDAAIIDMIITQDMTQVYIADKFGLTRAAVSRIYRNFITAVREGFKYNGSLIF